MTVDIYWNIAIYSSGFLGLVVLLTFIGLDVDHFEIELFGGDFSFNSLIAFVCIGGWAGYFGHTTTDMSEFKILMVAIFMGSLAFVGSILMMKKLKGLNEKGNIDINNAVGKTGKVYLGIPGNGEGSGQVQLVVQGRLKTFHAKTNQDKIETGTEILVYDVQGNVLFVEPYKTQ
ncbi:MAG: NfeD family protein [Cyclobacteriaceae bacterium]